MNNSKDVSCWTKRPLISNNLGFTLIEVIIILLLAGTAGLMFVTLTMENMHQSYIPVTRSKEMYHLIDIMERINRDYQNTMLAENSLSDLRDFINSNYIAYQPGPGIDPAIFISFTASGGDYLEDIPADQSTLKVHIKSNNQSLIALFTQ